MKKLFAMVLAVLLVGFLAVTNPTAGEFAKWYSDRMVEDDSFLQAVQESYIQYLEEKTNTNNCMLFSVFEYEGHRTLGIAMLYFPLDAMEEQIGAFRERYAQWLEERSDS